MVALVKIGSRRGIICTTGKGWRVMRPGGRYCNSSFFSFHRLNPHIADDCDSPKRASPHRTPANLCTPSTVNLLIGNTIQTKAESATRTAPSRIRFHPAGVSKLSIVQDTSAEPPGFAISGDLVEPTQCQVAYASNDLYPCPGSEQDSPGAKANVPTARFTRANVTIGPDRRWVSQGWV